MNLQRLEMMRVMMERVVAGSWEPTTKNHTLAGELTSGIAKNFKMEGLDLDSWVWYNNRNDTGKVCGFTACAIGHACFDDEFRKLGWSWGGSAQPIFNHNVGWDAVQEFFGFSHVKTGKILFVDNSYTPTERASYDHYNKAVREAKMVADRIKQLMETAEDKFLRHYGY